MSIDQCYYMAFYTTVVLFAYRDLIVILVMIQVTSRG